MAFFLIQALLIRKDSGYRAGGGRKDRHTQPHREDPSHFIRPLSEANRLPQKNHPGYLLFFHKFSRGRSRPLPATFHVNREFPNIFTKNTGMIASLSHGDVTHYENTFSHFLGISQTFFSNETFLHCGEIPVENPHFSTFFTGFSTACFHRTFPQIVDCGFT